MVQTSVVSNGRGKGGGPATVEGRQRQVASRLSHGIKYQSPVLPGVEAVQSWEAHLSGVRESLSPVGTFEEALVHQIAFQLWRANRLIRHETGLVHDRIVNPDGVFDRGTDKETIQEVIAKSSEQLESELSAAEELVGRYATIATGGNHLPFTAEEVRKLLESILDHIESNLEYDDDKEMMSSDAEEEELDIEQRQWSGAEVAEQIKLFAEMAGVDWFEELSLALDKERREIFDRREALANARQHIERELVPPQDDVVRLGVYERQILASFKHYYNALQRTQALRLGQPVAAPIALDVTLSGNDQLSE